MIAPLPVVLVTHHIGLAGEVVINPEDRELLRLRTSDFYL
jgi:hypothetical protein